MERIQSELDGAEPLRIHKQDWRPREHFEGEIEAVNVVYMLVDSNKRLLYVDEAENLIARLRRGHEAIRDWDHYRYDALPTALAPFRLQIERMLIRDMDAFFGASATLLPVAASSMRLVNVRIDRR